MARILLLSLLGTLLMPLHVSAQAPAAAAGDSDAAVTDSKVGNFTLDLSVPESPAFSVLNLTPSTIARPNTVQQLATSLLNGVDQNGNFQSGVAVDFQPYMLWYGRLVTWNTYARSYVTRFLSRAQLSVATTRGASEADKATRVALGLRLTIFDLGDPFRDQDTADCLAEAHLNVLDQLPTPGPGDAAAIEAHQVNKLKLLAPLESACRTQQEERARTERWNNSSFILAAAPTWASPDGTSKRLQSAGAGVWASLGYGFENIPGLEDSSQLILHYRHRERELMPAPTEDETPFEQDSDSVGLRWRIGSANGTGSFEYLFNRKKVAGRPNDKSSRLSLAVERRVSGNTWLTVSFGADQGRDDGKGGGFVLSSLAWSLNDRP